MPTVEDHKEIAMSVLKSYAQPDTEPKLSDPELNAILGRVQMASFWLAETAYTFGDVVLPATKNGHRYKCLGSGTTGATEPTWPAGNAAEIIDGTVRWEEAGPDFDNVFDIRAAVHEAWTIKEGKASVLVDQQGQRYSQLPDRCRKMADSFEPFKFA